MEHSVKVSGLPDNIAFPDRLHDRIKFDPVRGELSFRGFMTKCTYDELAALGDDADYRRALEHLFVLTSEEVAPRMRSRGLPATVLIAVATAILAAVVSWVIARQPQQPASPVPTTTMSSAS